jgi:hypothetical protein
MARLSARGGREARAPASLTAELGLAAYTFLWDHAITEYGCLTMAGMVRWARLVDPETDPNIIAGVFGGLSGDA